MKPIERLERMLPDLYRESSCDHDIGHIKRVIRNARLIGKGEGADLSLLLPAAMLHDIALKKGTLPETNERHAPLGAKLAEGVLKDLGFSNVRGICSVIRQHSLDSPTGEPRTLEGDCLFDADKLDAITPIGVARFLQERALALNIGPEQAARIYLKWVCSFNFRTRTGRRLGKGRKEAATFAESIIKSSSL
jgi:HD superfamily phosphodiesterase